MEERVVVYTSTYCQYCSHVKKFLGERNVNSKSGTSTRMRSTPKSLWNTGMRAVPVTLIGRR